MERFRIIRPSAVLAPFVRHYWMLESDDALTVQRIIPTGSVELVFHRGSPLSSAGRTLPHTSLCGQSLSFSDLAPTGKVDMISVVFHPFGAKAFFEEPLCELSTHTGADELNLGALRELEDKIRHARGDSECIGFIESFLLGRLNGCKEYNYRRIAGAVDAVNRFGGEISVSRLAENACLGTKQFQRLFREYVGLAPKEFMRVVRFHKALYTMQNDPLLTFTQVACECGYYDQSHMIGEFRRFSGYTPGEYLARCEPHSDYFSE